MIRGKSTSQSVRVRIYRFLHLLGPEVEKKLHSRCMVLLVLASAVALVLSSEPSIADHYFLLFMILEAFASSIFLLEYLLRLWSSPEQDLNRSTLSCRLHYVFSVMGLVDLASFLPFFLLASGYDQTSVLILLQLMRLFKLTRYSPAFGLLADVLKDEAESLLVAITLMFIIFIFASVGIYTFEHEVQPEAFGSIPHAMWWAIVTLTTVGYGDVTPVTVYGKIFATLITIVGVGLVSLPAGIIASGFTEQLRLRRERFQSEVEQLIDEDGELTEQDLADLNTDRKELGLNSDKAQLIISQVKNREQGYRRKYQAKNPDKEE
ncbi:MAG TPA: ion transporter [Desulfobulbaceae bacterium]|nr:ion transporter [Desulfobulbaceae bacterium]